MMESGQQLQRPQSIIPQEGLQKMGKDLVRLCDSIERHGLVDYQYGVWEEQIIDSGFSTLPLAHRCLFADERLGGSPGGVPGSL